MLLLLNVLQQTTDPTPDPKMDIIKLLIIMVTIIVSGGAVFAGGVIVGLLFLVRAVRKNPEAITIGEHLVAALERSHPGSVSPEQGKNLANLARESGDLIEELTDDIPFTEKNTPGQVG